MSMVKDVDGSGSDGEMEFSMLRAGVMGVGCWWRRSRPGVWIS